MTDETKLAEDEVLEDQAEEAAAEDAKEAPGNFWTETFSMVFWALLIAFLLRTFLFQPFHIPSASMEPNLYKGDYIIASKYSVGYGKHSAAPIPMPFIKGRWFETVPERGDVLIFKPKDQQKNFIKRLVGLPGDRIQMINGTLYVNGKAAGMEEAEGDNLVGGKLRDQSVIQYVETLPSGAVHNIQHRVMSSQEDNTEEFIVPSGYYFFLGDNRDNSLDSRVRQANGGVSYVPRENLMGKAEFILLSVNDNFVLFKPWTWLNFHNDRWFKGIK